MTYEEAKMQIQAIPEKIWDQLSEPDREAMEMAFSALQAQDSPKPKAESVQNVQNEDLISRKAAIDALMEIMDRPNHAEFLYTDEICKTLNELPSEQPEIVRCKDCKYRGGLSGFYCDNMERAVGVDSFCSWAERRTNE